MFCHKCGEKIVEGAVFCSKCGERQVNNNQEKQVQKSMISGEKDKAIIFRIGNNKISFSSNECVRIKIESPFHVYAYRAKEALHQNIVRKVRSFDDLYTEGFGYYIYALQKCTCRLGVKVLLANGIDYYDETSLWEKFIEEFDFESSLGSFLKGQRLITEAIEKLTQYRKAQRDNRSHWSGGGFGIKGALKGAMKAGALNVATDMLRSVSDSFVDDSDRKTINDMKRELYKTANIEICLLQSLYQAVAEFGAMVYRMYMETSPYEKIKWLEEKKVEAKCNNAVEPLSNEREALVRKICECVENNPYVIEPIEALLNIEGWSDDYVKLTKFIGCYEEILVDCADTFFNEIHEGVVLKA